MSDNNLYCSLAFNSISFGAHGGSRPCCAVDTTFWQEITHTFPDFDNHIIKWFNNKDIVNLRQDLLDGKWNPICNLCKMREQHGQSSTRQIFNRTLDEVEKKTNRSWKTPSSEINDLSNIFLLDITVGNKCNSACLMCNSSASSLWAKEQLEITGNIWQGRNLNWFSEEQIPNLVDNLPNLTAIQFAGGEPTINEAQIFLLNRLIEQGRSKNISLGYVTNLTGISEELLELWSHFGTKHITVSIDGVGSVNEYQRFPFSWKKVLSNFHQLKKISAEKKDYYIGLSHTITSMNILCLDEMISWWETQIEPGNGVLTSLPHIQCVNNPDYLDPVYIPKIMKKDCSKMIDNLIYYCEKNNLVEKYKPAIDNILTNIVNKEIDDEVQKNQWQKMKNFIEPLDKYRGRNIFDFLPFMRKYW